MNSLAKMARIAIVGEGVVGISTALSIQQRLPDSRITIFSDAPFEKSCSYGPAGLFRIDNINWEKNRKYGKVTFDWLAGLARTRPGSESGVKLLSGHIQSDKEENLKNQERAYADIVYNFRWLSEAEMRSQFQNPAKYCIHYSAYAAEGNLYVPFLRSLLENVSFEQQKVDDLAELGNSFDIVVNCAGLNGGNLAGDDDTMIPVRGIVALVDAPWHKEFLYRDFSTFTIPKNDVVVVGSVKTDGDWRRDHDQSEVDEILRRYYELQPAMKKAPVVGSWCALRPFRPAGIRIDSVVRKNKNGGLFSLVNHYGHGSNGFTLGWGSAQDAAELVEKAVALKSKL